VYNVRWPINKIWKGGAQYRQHDYIGRKGRIKKRRSVVLVFVCVYCFDGGLLLLLLLLCVWARRTAYVNVSRHNTEKEEKKYLIIFLGGIERKKRHTHTYIRYRYICERDIERGRSLVSDWLCTIFTTTTTTLAAAWATWMMTHHPGTPAHRGHGHSQKSQVYTQQQQQPERERESRSYGKCYIGGRAVLCVSTLPVCVNAMMKNNMADLRLEIKKETNAGHTF
jgi:hypothetical protein